MVEQLDLTNEDVTVIAELIDDLILKLVPSWETSSETLSTAANSSTGHIAILLNDETSLRCHWDSVLAKPPSEAAHKQRLLQTRNKDSADSDISAEYGNRIPSDAYSFKSLWNISLDGCDKEDNYEAHFGENLVINETTANFGLSYIDACSDQSKNISLSSIGSSSLGDKIKDDGLKQELQASSMLF